MARKAGVVKTMSNLWRLTIWGLALILVVALWLGWSNQDGQPDETVVAGGETAAEEPTEVGALDVTVTEAEDAATDSDESVTGATANLAEAAEAAADQVTTEATEAANDAAASVQSALESAVTAASEAVRDVEDGAASLADRAETAVEDARKALTTELGAADPAPATLLEETTSDPATADTDLPAELSNLIVPGDDATYAVETAFRRDDGAIAVTSTRTVGGDMTRTSRLVTCAPLQVGIFPDGADLANDTPELERIALGNAEATIAAAVCGALN